MPGKRDIEAGRAFLRIYLKNDLLKQLRRSMLQARNSLRSAGESMQRIGRTALTTGASLSIPFALATRTFAGFDDAMRTVRAVTGSTDAEFTKLTETAKLLGRTTSFTATQVAELMIELGRAGFAADDIDRMTGSVLNLSRATNTDAAQAAGIMAASLRQFGLGATEATRVADALTATANKSFNTLESLGESLSYAGPVAADFNMSIEETLAILGTLGNVGIQGSSAGTAIRRMLIVTGAQAEKLQKIFGVSFKDSVGNARPLVTVLDEVAQATKGLGSAERAKKFNEAFGLLGITAASVSSKTVTSTRELLSAITQSGGIAEKTATEMDAGIGGSFRKLLSAIEGVAIEIGSTLSPVLSKVSDLFTGFAGRVTEWVKANRGLVAGIALTVTAIATAGAGLIALGTAAIAGSLGIGAITGGIGVLGSLLAGLASPLGILAASLTAGITLWSRYSESGQAAVTTLKEFFGDLKTTANDTFNGIAEALKSGDLALAGEIALVGLQLAAAQGLEGLRKLFGEATGAIGQALAEGDIRQAGRILWGHLKLQWLEGTKAIREAWIGVTIIITDVFNGTMTQVRKVWVNVVSFIKSSGTRILGFLLNLAKKLGIVKEGFDVESALAEIEAERKSQLGDITLDSRQFTDERDENAAKQMQQIEADIAAARTEATKTVTETPKAFDTDELSTKLRQLTEKAAERAAEKEQTESEKKETAETKSKPTAGVSESGSRGVAGIPVTFSAAAAVAAGFGASTPEQRMAKQLDKIAGTSERQAAAAEKAAMQLEKLNSELKYA